MNIEENQIKEKPIIINIFPIKKGRRVLLYLADLFICFIISFILYNIASYPIAYNVSHYESKHIKALESQENINRLLSNNHLIYFEDITTDVANTNTGLEYTFTLYIKDYVSDDVVSHDIFQNYFVGIKNDVEALIDGYKTFDKSGYFVIDEETAKISLSSNFKELFTPLLSSSDGLSEKGQKEYENMFDKFFLTFYSRVFNDLKVNGLVSNNISYIEEQNNIDIANKTFDIITYVCTFVSFALGIIICYIVIPATNQYRKTIAMLMMKIQRIDINSMKILTFKRNVLLSLTSFVTHAIFICFLPLLSINIEYMFNLTLTLWVSVASLLVTLTSLIILLSKKSNQSLFDSLSLTAYISDDSLDEIFRARGYYI